MGTAMCFAPEMPVVGVLSSLPESADPLIEERLSAFLGVPAFRSPREEFRWTDYYVPEMGPGICRYRLGFALPADPAGLAGLKLATNGIEEEFAVDGRRRVNLDPGFLSPGRLVLATTKDRAHRIALTDGIYAELTLIYQAGGYRALPWTYPDWGSEECRETLARWRTFLLKALREKRGS